MQVLGLSICFGLFCMQITFTKRVSPAVRPVGSSRARICSLSAWNAHTTLTTHSSKHETPVKRSLFSLLSFLEWPGNGQAIPATVQNLQMLYAFSTSIVRAWPCTWRHCDAASICLSFVHFDDLSTSTHTNSTACVARLDSVQTGRVHLLLPSPSFKCL
jgi:hypothetical protein